MAGGDHRGFQEALDFGYYLLQPLSRQLQPAPAHERFPLRLLQRVTAELQGQRQWHRGRQGRLPALERGLDALPLHVSISR